MNNKILKMAIEAIEEEPEYPGQMPKALKDTLEFAIQANDIDLIEHMIRTSVRLTKGGILERLIRKVQCVPMEQEER